MKIRISRQQTKRDAMKILSVHDKKTRSLFLQAPRIIYKDDPWWVCPLDSETESRFNPEENNFLKDGEADRWVLLDDQEKPIGRIAAFYNRIKAYENDQPTGGIGMFECINSTEASHLLFDTAREWLRSKGMEAMDGPINFGENDSNWGLLIEGFTHPGMGMPYHLPYYKNLFEEYGFKEYFRQFSYHLDIRKPFPERFWKIADWMSRRQNFRFKHFTFREQDKFISDMVKIYNEAWAVFKEDYTPLDPQTVRNTINKARFVIDENLIWFSYHDDEPIGFFIMFPDINQILKPFNGKMNLWNILRFFYYKKTKKINRVRAMVAGVVPRFQNSGVESAIFRQLEKVFFSKPYLHYKEIELSWVGDFNPKMRSLYEAVGAKLAKIHVTYRYLFDPTKPFRRFMPEAVEKASKFDIRQHHVEE